MVKIKHLMKITGQLLKMRTALDSTIQYYLTLNKQEILLNDLINKKISLSFLNMIHCIRCGRETTKSYHQGFCYPCFKTAPETDDCILKPELCKAQEGISRDMEWARKHCLQEHIVYLAISSNLKVGVTRLSQVPTRWIDQGASSAIKIAKTPNRNIAGQIEVNLKKHFADKTNWRNMLTNKIDKSIDLREQKEKAQELVKKDLSSYFINNNDEVLDLNYPVLKYPEKVKSFSFDKESSISGTLIGIKGQYLIFDDGLVLNIRKHNGYEIELTI